METPDQLACTHHFILSDPHVHFERPGNKGELVEDTYQVCKICGFSRIQTVVIPPDTAAVNGMLGFKFGPSRVF